jgi:hypothetical protein
MRGVAGEQLHFGDERNLTTCPCHELGGIPATIYESTDGINDSNIVQKDRLLVSLATVCEARALDRHDSTMRVISSYPHLHASRYWSKRKLNIEAEFS